jgi:hypothetical protein
MLSENSEGEEGIFFSPKRTADNLPGRRRKRNVWTMLLENSPEKDLEPFDEYKYLYEQKKTPGYEKITVKKLVN